MLTLSIALSGSCRALNPGETASPAAQPLIGSHDRLKVVILADTNRDGTVDVTGASDLHGKERWSRKRGALLLANIGDTNRRCSSRIYNSTSDHDLEKCHDASDNVLRNPGLLATIRTIPNRRLSPSAVGSLLVPGNATASKVRLFHKTRKGWAYVSPGYTFSAEHLRAGLELGIDARDVRRPGVWDGRVTVELHVRDDEAEARDSVALRVAPVLTHHHGQTTKQVITQAPFRSHGSAAQQDLGGCWQGSFVEALQNATRRAQVEGGLFILNDTATSDIWVQDFFEPGYMSMPGPGGLVGLHIMIRSAQNERRSGRQIFTCLRSNTTSAVQFLADGGSTDSMGNLETIPPHSHEGKWFPAGRIVMGVQSGRPPRIMPFLRAQEEQDPVEIDTSWLAVGNADEFLQFLPADNELGWVMVVSDPESGLGILEKAKKAGRGKWAATSQPWLQLQGPKCVPPPTIDQVLELADFRSVQEHSGRMIEKSVDVIKRETGVAEGHIIRIPALFYKEVKPFWDKKCLAKTEEKDGKMEGRRGANHTRHNSTSKLVRVQHYAPRNILQAGAPARRQRRGQEPTTQLSAFYPATVNSVVLSRSLLAAPNPWGPVIDGVDVLAAATTEAYARVNYTVAFVDDWMSHHMGSDNVHCGSNTIRDMDGRWW